MIRWRQKCFYILVTDRVQFECQPVKWGNGEDVKRRMYEGEMSEQQQTVTNVNRDRALRLEHKNDL